MAKFKEGKTRKFQCLTCDYEFEVKEPEATEIEGDCPACGSTKIKEITK